MGDAGVIIWMTRASACDELDSTAPAPVAQWIERCPPEAEVAGSNPAGRVVPNANGDADSSAPRYTRHTAHPRAGSLIARVAAWRVRLRLHGGSRTARAASAVALRPALAVRRARRR